MKRVSLRPVKNQIVETMKSLMFGPFSVFRDFNVCMWHTGRCGSTVIAKMLEQDGRIDWGHEVLKEFSKNPPQQKIKAGEILNEMSKRIKKRQRLAGRRPFGFEMKLWHYHRLNLSLDEVYDLLLNMGYPKHIILERKNYLRVLFSARMAFATGKWHLEKGEKDKSRRIRLDYTKDELLSVMESHEQFYHDLHKRLPHDSLYISYEDHIQSNPYIGYSKIIEYLGFTPKTIDVPLKKTNPEKLSELMENYGEISEYLSGTPYFWMVES